MTEDEEYDDGYGAPEGGPCHCYACYTQLVVDLDEEDLIIVPVGEQQVAVLICPTCASLHDDLEGVPEITEGMWAVRPDGVGPDQEHYWEFDLEGELPPDPKLWE